MPVRISRISFVLLAAALLAALIAGCQSQTPAPSSATAVSPSANGGAAAGYPASQPAAASGYPAAPLGQALEPTAYPAGYTGGTGSNPGAGPAAGVPALPNKADVVAQLIEQRAGASADQVILHVKMLSAQPQAGSTDFVSQLVNQEVDLVASKDGLPQLAANDQFQAVVSMMGDENSKQYSASEIKKK